jgi:hypothetical protein
VSLFNKVGNIVSGRNLAFNERFPVAMRSVRDKVDKLPAARNEKELAVLATYRAMVENTLGFSGQLIFPRPEGWGLVKVSALQKIPIEQAHVLFALMLTGLIRYSLTAHPKLSPVFASFAELTVPPFARESVAKLSQQMEGQNVQEGIETLLGIMTQYFPETTGDPIMRLGFEGLISVWAAINLEDVKKAVAVFSS